MAEVEGEEDLVAVKHAEEKKVPAERDEVEHWVLDLLSTHPKGLTPSRITHEFFREFQAPLCVPLPHAIPDQDNPPTDNAAEDLEDFFEHAHTLPVREPLKVLLKQVEGLIYEQQSNKFMLGDQYQLLRIRMRMAVEKIADETAVTQAHWIKLFRRLDRDESGKLDRKEFYTFVRDMMKLPARDFPDKTIWDMFIKMDRSHSNLVTIGDLVHFAQGEPFSKIGEDDIALS